jgi:hypothetical protein
MRHPGKHAHPALGQQFRPLALGEDTREEPVEASLPDLRTNTSRANARPGYTRLKTPCRSKGPAPRSAL